MREVELLDNGDLLPGQEDLYGIISGTLTQALCSTKAQHHLPKTIRDIPSPYGTLDTRKLYQDSSLESSAAIRREDAPLLTRRYRSPRPLDPRRNPLPSPKISIVSGINLLFSTQIPSFISQLVITLERSYCWIDRFDRNRFSRPDNLCPR